MSAFSRFNSMPLAARMLAWFGVGLLGYFFALEPLLDMYNEYRQVGDIKQSELERTAAAGEAVKRAGENALLGVNRFGAVDFPSDPQARSLAFNKVVGEILQKHGITGETSTTRTTPLTGSSALVKKAATANFRIDKLTKTLEFQADADAVAKVIADLEQSPLVSTISNVQVRQVDTRNQTQRQVSASITAETWVLARKERGR